MPKATLVDAVVDDGKTPAVEAIARKVKKPKNATSARRGRNKLKAAAASAAVAATSISPPPPPPGMLAASSASPSIDANSVFVAVGLVPTAALEAQTFPTDDPVIQEMWKEGMEEGSQAYNLAQVLMDSIGPRLTGTSGYVQAAEWLESLYLSLIHI